MYFIPKSWEEWATICTQMYLDIYEIIFVPDVQGYFDWRVKSASKDKFML